MLLHSSMGFVRRPRMDGFGNVCVFERWLMFVFPETLRRCDETVYVRKLITAKLAAVNPRQAPWSRRGRRFGSEQLFAGTAALFSSLACIWSSAERGEKPLGGTAFSSEAVFPPRPIDFHHVKVKSDVSGRWLLPSCPTKQQPRL